MTNIITKTLVSIGLLSSDETNARIRDSYNDSVNKAYEEFTKTFTEIHLNHQSVAESVAHEASSIRLELKKQAQESNTFLEKTGLYIRDLSKSALSFFSSKPAKNSEELAYSAFKTGGGDLGLENNGFGDILKTWKIINKDTDYVVEKGIYPEAISTEESYIFNECFDAGKSVDECIGASGITGLYENEA